MGRGGVKRKSARDSIHTHHEYMFADNPIIHSSLVGQGRKERKRGQRALGHKRNGPASGSFLSTPLLSSPCNERPLFTLGKAHRAHP